MWKDIDKFEDRYEVSSDGEVRNKHTKRLLTPTSDKDGYQQIGIRKMGDRKKVWFRIHRLVAIGFVERPGNWLILSVDHIDRNKTNNKYTNLRWVTAQENCNNRKDECWITNTTTKELHISAYKNGFMLRINRDTMKHRSWHRTLDEAIQTRNNL
jgi:hypothetical protein